MSQVSLGWFLTKEAAVLAAMRRLGGVACMAEIRKETGLPANSITGRLADLEQKGFISIANHGIPEYCPTAQRKTKHYKINN